MEFIIKRIVSIYVDLTYDLSIPARLSSSARFWWRPGLSPRVLLQFSEPNGVLIIKSSGCSDVSEKFAMNNSERYINILNGEVLMFVTLSLSYKLNSFSIRKQWNNDSRISKCGNPDGLPPPGRAKKSISLD